MVRFIAVIFKFFWLLSISSCAGVDLHALTEKLPHTSQSFSMKKSGYEISTEFLAGGNLLKRYRYTMYLNFQALPSESIDASRLRHLLGLTASQVADQSAGIDIPIRIQIGQVINGIEVIFYDKKFAKLYNLGWWEHEFNKGIDSIFMDPGKYTVRVKLLDAVPELANVPVTFEIGLPGKH